jgi:hypothetical protein
VWCIQLQLIDQVVSGNEYWLSINADVALWLDWRTFNKMPLLSAVSDFVLVSSEIHHEFDEFVKMEGSTGTTLLPAVDLIHFWASTKGQSLSLVHRYGKQYVQISSLQLDDICLWVRGMREQYARCGKSVFEAASSSVHKVTSLSTSSLKVRERPLRESLCSNYCISVITVATGSGPRGQ